MRTRVIETPEEKFNVEGFYEGFGWWHMESFNMHHNAVSYAREISHDNVKSAVYFEDGKEIDAHTP